MGHHSGETTPQRSLNNNPRDLVGSVLDFLSSASNEALGACLVGLCATTYLVLGRIGLLLIGIVCGIALHATWERSAQTDPNIAAEEVRRKKEIGVDVIRRVLDLRDGRQGNRQKEYPKRYEVEVLLSAGKALDFRDFRPATGAALTVLVDAIIRDYVKWWYGPLLPHDDSFPFASRQILTGFVLAVSSHLSRKRPADTFLNFLTNASSILIVFLGELSNALMSDYADTDTAVAINRYLEENPDCNLANVLDPKQQANKFKAAAEDVLETFLDSKAYNCEPVRVFLQEVLAGLILEMTLRSCSKPEWINGWIVYLLEDGEPELMNAMDAGMGGASNKDTIYSTSQKPPRKSMTLPNGDQLPHGESQQNPSRSSNDLTSTHKRNMSDAEDAMEEAMREAKRLTELIAAEDAKNNKYAEGAGSSNLSGLVSSFKPLVYEATVTPRSSSETHPDKAERALEYARSLDVRRSTFDEIASSEQTTGSEYTPMSSQSDLNGSDIISGLQDEEGNTTRNESASPVTFDQILSKQSLNTADSSRSQPIPPMTLYNASVTIFDDAMPGEKANSVIRAKPTIDYLLQVEPASSQHPGWMMARQYADFETLHEIIGTISKISGVTVFTHKYQAFPTWRNKTKTSLRHAMEVYLRDALSHVPLAESEGMKRFLEKDQTLGRLSGGLSSKGVLGFPTPSDFETMGKGMLDVLVSAPKGVAGGSKALLEGVSGVFGQKRPMLPPRPSSITRTVPLPSSHRNTVGDDRKYSGSPSQGRHSVNTSRPSPEADPENSHKLLSDISQTISTPAGLHDDALSASHIPGTSTNSLPAEVSPEAASPLKGSEILNNSSIRLPPLPTEISDDYRSEVNSSGVLVSPDDVSVFMSALGPEPPTKQAGPSLEALSSTGKVNTQPAVKSITPKRETPPLTEQETQVAVELFFAMINELFTLSSAWNIRRTILNAAKAFLLRPGNPNLEAIRILIQDTFIEANTTDGGLASHIQKLRENSLPTGEELAAWPPPLTESEQESLRLKARKLLVERGMPQALTSVMGAAASGEALGRVFDSLQVGTVARGLIFAMLLQCVRAMTH